MPMRKLKKYKPTRFMAKTSHYDKEAADYAVMFIESLCHTRQLQRTSHLHRTGNSLQSVNLIIPHNSSKAKGGPSVWRPALCFLCMIKTVFANERYAYDGESEFSVLSAERTALCRRRVKAS